MFPLTYRDALAVELPASVEVAQVVSLVRSVIDRCEPASLLVEGHIVRFTGGMRAGPRALFSFGRSNFSILTPISSGSVSLRLSGNHIVAEHDLNLFASFFPVTAVIIAWLSWAAVSAYYARSFQVSPIAIPLGLWLCLITLNYFVSGGRFSALLFNAMSNLETRGGHVP
jgi:hypothetical protein